MLQTWILVGDLHPMEALKTGATKTICGGCPLQNNGCYVQVGQAPTTLWHAYNRGTLDDVTGENLSELFAGHAIRMGAYGDPAAVPVAVWSAMLSRAVMHTGYTHSWRGRRFAGLKQWCMASCDTDEDLADAVADGWATYRARPKGAPLLPGEVQCPASDEAGHLTDCRRCGRCGGIEASTRLKQLQLVSIEAHGAQHKRVHARRIR
jgi:hypothetical protein